jgi:simple sugar transport system ATP-binding protein
MSGTPAVTLDGVTHDFGANRVLKGVTFDIHAGEVLALVGANGAGKSTLIKLLSGVHRLQGGTVEVDGMPFAPESPLDAMRLGIQAVHQRIDEGIVPGLSVAENLLFDRLAQRELPTVRSLRQLLPIAREIAGGLGLEWDDAFLRRDVHELGVADKQSLVLARALERQPRLLILDEPTSALSQAESLRLFDVIDRLRADGVAIVYVSHRLGESDRVADRLVVLRDGRITSHQSSPFAWDVAVRDMLGDRVIGETNALVKQRGSEAVLELVGVRLQAESDPFDLSLRRGEVTGVIGLLGAGKSELAKGIFGAEPFEAGTMRLLGEPYTAADPHQAIARGVYLVPEDRAAEAMLPGWSIARTVSLPFMPRVCDGNVIRATRESTAGRRVIDRFGVVATSAHQQVDALSGGNQQKVVVGRWLEGRPLVMVLDEPFRGVDIGARHDISTQARDVAAGGATVLVLSADIDEILEVADRIVVLVDGALRLDAYAADVDRDQIVDQMSEVV